MGRRDILFKTWYLKKNRLINWDHYLFVETIEGYKLKLVQGLKGCAGWVPKSEEKKLKFKQQV